MFTIQLIFVYLLLTTVTIWAARAWMSPERTSRRQVARRIRVAATLILLGGVSIPQWWLLFPFGVRSCDMGDRIRKVQQRPFAYDRTGLPLGPLDERVGRFVALDKLKPGVGLVFAAAEDRRLFEHDGVDARGLARAAVRTFVDRRREGASTIDMQVARTVCGSVMPRDHTVIGKMSEIGAAIRLANAMPPRKVLELYVNTTFFGRNRWGLDAAARTYYGVPAEEVSVAEAAQLAALIRSPVSLDPATLGPDLSRQARSRVLRIAAASFPEHTKDFQAAEGQHTRVASRDPRMESGIANFIQVIADAGKTSHTNGDSIVSSLSLTLQRAAEHRVGQLIADIESGRWGRYTADTASRLQSVYVAMDAVTGEVLAYLPSRPDAPAGFDRIRRGSILWSSTGKPVMYGVDIDERRVLPSETIAEVLQRADVNVMDPWYRRISGKCHIERTLEAGIAHSDNCMAVALHRMITREDARRLTSLGIEVANPNAPVEALGIRSVSPLMILRVYGAIVNRGLLVQARYQAARSGSPIDTARLWSPETARLVAVALTEVVRSGTAKAIHERFPSAYNMLGKTGTADDGTEFLFVGASGPTVSLLWLGHDRRRPIAANAAAGDVVATTWADIIADHASAIRPVNNVPVGSAW
jgi:penicillin-binding protein 1A